MAITDYIYMLYHEWADKEEKERQYYSMADTSLLGSRSFDGARGGTVVVLFCIQNDINFNIKWLRFFTVSVRISSLLYLNTSYILI